jgi:mannose-6-phosphate isomerase-like protein (cupin superfamily)
MRWLGKGHSSLLRLRATVSAGAHRRDLKGNRPALQSCPQDRRTPAMTCAGANQCLSKGPDFATLSFHPSSTNNMNKINLADKFSQIHEYWKPYIAGELNGQLVKLDKLKGEFIWHHHENEDEMFLVVKGRFRIEFRDKTVWLEEGEFIVVPRGVEHKPVADEEAWILLFEPGSTLNTGNVENARTLRDLERV